MPGEARSESVGAVTRASEAGADKRDTARKLFAGLASATMRVTPWVITMKCAVEIEADDAKALDILMSATERWLRSIGATVLEHDREYEECTGYFIVESEK